MTVLEIITYPDPRLLEPSEPVALIDEGVRQLIADMAETMFDAPGVGLAAVQVGALKQILVYQEHPEENEKSFRALINPVIVQSEGKYLSENEGCLSVPDLRSNVQRAAKITVKALNIDGETIEFQAEGMHAVVLQHEIDHLNGVTLVDRVSALKREIYKRKVKKHLKAS
jgi:peptide deformylase